MDSGWCEYKKINKKIHDRGNFGGLLLFLMNDDVGDEWVGPS